MAQPLTVLVLGATGNVGKATTDELLKLAASRPVRVRTHPHSIPLALSLTDARR